MTHTENKPESTFVRYRWCKRILVVCASAVILLVLLRLWWGAYAHRRWQAQVERIRASGAPVRPDELNSEVPVADDNNAALALMRAADSLAFCDTSEKEIIDGNIQWELLTPVQWDKIEAFKRRNASGLALVRRARDMTDVDWGVHDQAAMSAMPVLSLSPQRQLARSLRAIARQQHRAGNDAEAIEYLLDLFQQAATVDEMHAIISHLVAMAIDALAVSGVESCLSDLQVGAAPAASRAQLQRLVQALLDEYSFQNGLRGALLNYRVDLIDKFEYLYAGKVGLAGTPAAGWPTTSSSFDGFYLLLFRPVLEMDGACLLQELDHSIAASEHPSWPEAHAIIAPAERRAASAGSFFRYPLQGMGYAAYMRGIFLHYRHLAYRRLALVALALRLYELDHGSRPQTLDALVPRYLAELPVDPLSPQGKTLNYRPAARIPILYSVGENGVDEGGLVWDAQKGSYDRWQRDIVFLLDDRVPDLPHAVDDQGQVADEPVDAGEDQARHQDPQHRQQDEE